MLAIEFSAPVFTCRLPSAACSCLYLPPAPAYFFSAPAPAVCLLLLDFRAGFLHFCKRALGVSRVEFNSPHRIL